LPTLEQYIAGISKSTDVYTFNGIMLDIEKYCNKKTDITFEQYKELSNLRFIDHERKTYPDFIRKTFENVD
jgi:hypothetical protein